MSRSDDDDQGQPDARPRIAQRGGEVIMMPRHPTEAMIQAAFDVLDAGEATRETLIRAYMAMVDARF